MQQPHGTRPGDFGRVQDQHLALDATQIGQHIARRQATAIYDLAFGRAGRVKAYPQRHRPFPQPRQGLARVQMRLASEMQPPVEPPRLQRLQPRNRRAVQPDMPCGPPREPVQFCPIPPQGQHE